MTNEIPENLEFNVHYDAKGNMTYIYFKDRLQEVFIYNNKDLEELTKNPESSEDYFRLLLNRNIRTLAIGAEDALLNWSILGQGSYRYRKVCDEANPFPARDLEKDPLIVRYLKYTLVRKEK